MRCKASCNDHCGLWRGCLEGIGDDMSRCEFMSVIGSRANASGDVARRPPPEQLHTLLWLELPVTASQCCFFHSETFCLGMEQQGIPLFSGVGLAGV